MKLNNFFTKPVVRQQAPVFHLGNESRENELEQQIVRLQEEVSSLRDKATEDRNLTQISKALRSEVRNEQIKSTSLSSAMQQQQITLDKLTNIEQEYIESAKQLQALNYKIEGIQDTMAAVQTINTEQQTELTTLHQEYTTLSGIYGRTKTKGEEIEKLLEEKIEQCESQIEKLEQFHKSHKAHIQETVKLKTTHTNFLHEIKYWKETARAFADQIDAFGAIEQKLQGWIKSLTDQNVQETSRSKGALSRLAKSQTVIIDMDKTILGMSARHKGLAEKNRELRIQVDKPTYASMGAIQRLENFTMSPMGAAVNSDKLYLGNGKPTLLKFKSKGQKYDNRTN